MCEIESQRVFQQEVKQGAVEEGMWRREREDGDGERMRHGGRLKREGKWRKGGKSWREERGEKVQKT